MMKKSVRARKHLLLRTLQLSIGLLLLFCITISPLYAGGDSDVASTTRVDDSYSANIPLDYFEITGEFYENQGQISDSSIQFYAELDGGYIGLGADRIMLWSCCSPPNDIIVFSESTYLEPIGLDKTGHIANYYLGSRGTYTNVQSYRAVLYEDVLPGVDMMFDNPSKGIICEVFSDEGFDFAAVSEMLKVTDRFDWIQEEKQKASDSLMRLNLRDRTRGEFLLSQNEEVLLSRCMRGSERDEAIAIARDTAGYLYITGRTASQDFPMVTAIDSSWNGGYDVFVTKIDSIGTVEYSTFIGGSEASMSGTQPDEIGNDITVDAAGNVYVAGNTKSDDFPRVNPLYSYPDDNATLRGEYRETEGDAFVLKLDSTGQLEYSTYFGGKSGDVAYSISLDADGNMYIGGRTASRVFPTVNAIDDLNDAGIYDGFISCISAAGDTLLFSTFFGGSQNEIVNDLAIDDSGNLVVTGNTGGGLSLINPHQSTFGGGGLDAFILKIDTGWNVVYSTYLGGSGSDQGKSVCVDSSGTAYVTGRTESPNFPNVAALTDDYGGFGDCYITAISYDGAGINFSSFVGGGGADTGHSIDIDAAGNIIVAGETYSQNFPGAIGGNSGGADGFVFKTNRTHVLYSTYIGGAENDEIRSMVAGSENDTYVCGITRSTDFPFAESPTDTTGFDAFVYAIRTFESAPVYGINGDWLIYLIPASVIAVAGIGIIFRRIILLNVRSLKRREYEVAMKAPGELHDEILWGPPTDYSEDMLYPERPVPQWNHPTDHPDGGLDPEKPVPQWNHPTDHPDGGLDPEKPVPQWNHPTDHPDGGLDPEKPVPQWNHPTDHPDGGLDPEKPVPQWNHPTDHPDGGLDPEKPVPQWNHPTDHPDGGLDPEKPVPQWNHPTDHPDGGLDPEKPVPQWNHPTDHPDGGLDRDGPMPKWNHPTDHPDGGLDPDSPAREWRTLTDYPEGAPEPLSLDQSISHLAEHPEGCICPLCSPDRYLEPTPEDIAEKSQKKSKKRRSDD